MRIYQLFTNSDPHYAQHVLAEMAYTSGDWLIFNTNGVEFFWTKDSRYCYDVGQYVGDVKQADAIYYTEKEEENESETF